METLRGAGSKVTVSPRRASGASKQQKVNISVLLLILYCYIHILFLSCIAERWWRSRSEENVWAGLLVRAPRPPERTDDGNYKSDIAVATAAVQRTLFFFIRLRKDQIVSPFLSGCIFERTDFRGVE